MDEERNGRLNKLREENLRLKRAIEEMSRNIEQARRKKEETEERIRILSNEVHNLKSQKKK